jgi:hypothetical protein
VLNTPIPFEGEAHLIAASEVLEAAR